MDSTLNPIAAGNGNGIGQRLIGLQPPLSPPPAATAAPAAPRAEAPPAPAPAPAPVAAAAPPSAPAPAAPTASTENLLVRFGLLSTDQLDEALLDQRESGKHVAQIAVERGWVTREQLAKLVPEQAPPSAPEPPPAPAPVAPPAPAAAVEPAPEPEPRVDPKHEEPAIETVARVYARLTTGERIEIASFPGLLEARQRAEEIVRDLKADRPEWPVFAGRFVRPEAIVSVGVEATLG